MLDLGLILDHTDDVAKRLATKGLDPAKVYRARDSVVHRRQVRTKLDELRSQMNQRSKDMGRLIAAKNPAADVLRTKLAELKRHIAELEEEHREADEVSLSLLLELPNLPDPQAPVGDDESANVVLRHGGPEATVAPNLRPHWEVAGDLGIFDPERAAKLSGSGFALLRGDGARLLRALVSFGLDLHRPSYEELIVPHLVRRPIMVGTGHLPKFADDAYSTTLDDFWAVPTGEVPLTALHRDEILDPEDLPRRYMTYTSCFRREAGSAGKDTSSDSAQTPAPGRCTPSTAPGSPRRGCGRRSSSTASCPTGGSGSRKCCSPTSARTCSTSSRRRASAMLPAEAKPPRLT